MKLASFASGKAKILAFKKAFHGRTSGAVSATDNPKIQAPFNKTDHISFVALNDEAAVERELASGEYAAVLIEGIQGVAGIYEPSESFLKSLRTLCDRYGAYLILDEIQSGYGRSGLFFAHQHAGIEADIITTAKGMGNGFPIGGVLISPKLKAEYGMLGTTFGGNHLACTAALAVIDVIENEHLIENAARMGEYFKKELGEDKALVEYRGKGLMIGMQLKEEYIGLRDKLLFEKHFFTGAAGAGVIRLLPSLTVSQETAAAFVKAWRELTV
jgi:acetylornithine aminotransferase